MRPSAGTPLAMKGTLHSALKPFAPTWRFTGRKPPSKLGCGQSPLAVKVVVLPQASTASRWAPENFRVAVASNWPVGVARPAAGAPKKRMVGSPGERTGGPLELLCRLTSESEEAGASGRVRSPTFSTTSAWAPRASEAPIRNSARVQSRTAPGGVLAADSARSKREVRVRSACQTGTLNSERVRTSEREAAVALAWVGKIRKTPRCAASFGAAGGAT